MRPAAYFFCVMVLGIAALAQDAAKQPSKDPSSANASAAARVPVSDNDLASASDNDTCYTIRAYFFRPSEDGGVEPAGMTTCVKSSQRALKRAQKRQAEPSPEVRLVH